MSGFLVQSSCEGRRPPRLKIYRYNSRPHLVSRLLSERNVARFVVAPDGFGKTSIVLEYAETIFHFEHVFWIDARNPRFLRDLDKGVLSKTLLEMDSSSFLVVMEDIPRLDFYRSRLLSKEIALLLDRGCEVIATCTPGCDAFSCHRDRIKLSSADLLLSVDEMKEYEISSARDSRGGGGVFSASFSPHCVTCMGVFCGICDFSAFNYA